MNLKHPYFAYGSNMNPKQMAQRCPGGEALGTAVLPGYRLAFTYDSPGWEGGVATVIPDPDSKVRGVYWMLNEEHLETLDRYEGVAQGIYERRLVSIQFNEQTQEAITYVTLDTTPHTPSLAYMQALIEGAQHFELPNDYLTFLRSITTA
jgi:gamma-glutamylcyclotransferase (GGCT)/AIG2-like uncharacterized protein YtfP